MTVSMKDRRRRAATMLAHQELLALGVAALTPEYRKRLLTRAIEVEDDPAFAPSLTKLAPLMDDGALQAFLANPLTLAFP